MTDPCEGKYDIVSRLRDHTNRDDNDIAEAAAYIERLRAERDEARREILESLHPDLRESYAAAREWDCFSDKAEADANNTLFRTTDGE